MAAFRALGPFPFCVTAQAENAAFSYLSMSLKMAMSAYWRVKNWRVVAASFSYEVGEGEPAEFNLGSPTLTLASPSSIEDEKTLVCGINRMFLYDSDPGTGGYSPFCAVFFQGDGRLSGNQVALAWDIRFGTSVAADLYISSRANNGVLVGSGTLLIGSDSITFSLYSNAYAEVSDIEFVLSAEEYWPYDPGDGLGPIYDSATGRQLRAMP